MKLAVVTPLTRGENLEKIMLSIMDAGYATSEALELTWFILEDPIATPIEESLKNFIHSVNWIQHYTAQESAIAGHTHRNAILQYIQDYKDTWFYSVDDDNIIHPDFLDEFTKNAEGSSAIVVSQYLKDGSKRLTAAPENTKLNHIDTAQYVFKVEDAKGLYFDGSRYDADGVFIEELYNRIPEKFKFIDKPLSYYNFLR